MHLLELNETSVCYDDVQVLRNISLNVNEGEMVSIIGSNGSGKSTIINSVCGIVEIKSGQINFENQRIDGLQLHEIVQLGIVQIPEGRRLFPYMTILENLEMGAFSPRAKQWKKESLGNVYSLFPILEERKYQLARTLSGGEAQMLAIGRGLMAKPKLLALDEPSLGLAPILVHEIFDAIDNIKKNGTTVLLVEQDVQISLSLSDRGYVIENGQIVMQGNGHELLQDPHIRETYLGI